MTELKFWLWFIKALNPGNVRIWEILDEFDSVENAHNAIINGEFTKLSDNEKKAFSKSHLSQVEKIIEYCNEKEINVICYNDSRYPKRLKGIYNPPSVLFCYGDLSFVDDEVAITVVGTRQPTPYYVEVTKDICNKLSETGVVLVSGFALGIDSMAHQAALKNNNRTIAVLGCGIDYDYPAENSKVKKLIAKKGAVISEYFPGTKPIPSNFPQRNRILSGLSLGTLVIQAGERSGSLITAELALQQGRDIFCIPPSDIRDKNCTGVVRLIRDGAISTFSYLDIIYEYYEKFSYKLSSMGLYGEYKVKTDDSMIFESDEKQAKSKVKKSKPSLNETQSDNNSIQQSYDVLTKEQQLVVSHLKNGSMLIDEISNAVNIEISELLMILTDLELEGVVKSLAGKRYSL